MVDRIVVLMDNDSVRKVQVETPTEACIRGDYDQDPALTQPSGAGLFYQTTGISMLSTAQRYDGKSGQHSQHQSELCQRERFARARY
jgi:hypothetical protein